MLRYCFLMFMMLPQLVFAQDISGTWAGNYGKGKLDADIPGISLQLKVGNSFSLSGVLTVHFEGDRHQKYAVSGRYDSIGQTVLLKEDSGISHNVAGYRVLRDYTMQLTIHEDKLRLEGISRNYADGILVAAKLKVWFEKLIELPAPTQAEVQPIIAKDTTSIAGKWVGAWGKGNQDSDITNQHLNLILTGDSIKGSLREYVSKDKYQDFIVSGFLRDNMLHLAEDSVNVHNLNGPRALRDYKMKVVNVDGKIRFEGISRSYTVGIITASKVPVWFEREIQAKDTANIPVTIIEEPSAKRPVKITQTIQVEMDSPVRIEISDNARIDHDIISLYVNDKKLLDKQALSGKPLICNFTLTSDETRIEMYAESSGSMPPCTATMKIITQQSSHIVNLSSDFKINEGVRLVLKK